MKIGFLDWIRVKDAPDFLKARSLGVFVGFLLTLIGVLVVMASIATLLQFVFAVFRIQVDHAAIRNLGLILVAVLGAPFVVWRAFVAQKQADIAEQGHITDQINKAVEGLGSEKATNKIGRPVQIYTGHSTYVTHHVQDSSSFEMKPRSIEIERNYGSVLEPGGEGVLTGWEIEVRSWEAERTVIEWQGIAFDADEKEHIGERGEWAVFSETLPNIEVRVGAIYALERILNDSPRDHIQIMEILTAYIRGNAPVGDLEPTEEPFKVAKARTDIQSALDVLARRNSEGLHLEKNRKYRLDLREVDLSGASFSNGSFDGVLLGGSRLEAANFRGTSLKGARLNNTLLNHADFFSADLEGAIIDGSRIDRVGGWNGSVMSASNMRGLSMAAANISGIKFLRKKETHLPTFATKDTVLEFSLDIERKNSRQDLDELVYVSNDIESEDEQGVRERLGEKGFMYWSPFESTDGATDHMRVKMWDDLGLTGFPFRD